MSLRINNSALKVIILIDMNRSGYELTVVHVSLAINQCRLSRNTSNLQLRPDV